MDKLGELLDNLGLKDSVDGLISQIKEVMQATQGGLDEFINWFPLSVDDFKKLMLDAFRIRAFDGAFDLLDDYLKQWVEIENDSGRVCFSVSSFVGTDGALKYTSPDELTTVDLYFPLKKNCFGVEWNNIEMHDDRMAAFFNRIVKDNPIAQVGAALVMFCILWR